MNFGEHPRKWRRLTDIGLHCDREITEFLITIAQGLSVPRRSFVRALNIIALDRQHFAIVLDAALRITEGRTQMNGIEAAALERMRTLGGNMGWFVEHCAGPALRSGQP
jgi:hypothetical protein